MPFEKTCQVVPRGEPHGGHPALRQPLRRQYDREEFPEDFPACSELPCFHPEERLSFGPRCGFTTKNSPRRHKGTKDGESRALDFECRRESVSRFGRVPLHHVFLHSVSSCLCGEIQNAISNLMAMPGKQDCAPGHPTRGVARDWSWKKRKRRGTEARRNRWHGEGEVSNSPCPLFLCASATLCFKSGE
jgi:hypothetical protein